MADELTGQQIEQALRIVADCCARAEPPAGSSMTNWEWTDTTRQSVNILSAVAVTALKQAAADADAEETPVGPVMGIPVMDDAEPVSVNGDQ